jgi:hypothetical protein
VRIEKRVLNEIPDSSLLNEIPDSRSHSARDLALSGRRLLACQGYLFLFEYNLVYFHQPFKNFCWFCGKIELDLSYRASGPSVCILASSANGLEQVGVGKTGMQQPLSLARMILWKGSEARMHIQAERLIWASWNTSQSRYIAAVTLN